MLNLMGQKFGRLIATQRVEKDQWGNYKWLCVCTCGKTTIVPGSDLRKNKTKSCGCLHDEGNNTNHGHTKNGRWSQAYRSWAAMMHRCTNPRDEGYHNYGGRGIRVCNMWLKFDNFLKDMCDPPTQHHSIDRIDNNGDYCKENCRWATPQQQARNKRNNHLETYDGKTQCLAAWAEETGISPQILWKRFNRGWSPEKALTTPVKNDHPIAKAKKHCKKVE